jgi:hypothetical protein
LYSQARCIAWSQLAANLWLQKAHQHVANQREDFQQVVSLADSRVSAGLPSKISTMGVTMRQRSYS